jgi:predicted transcriptional regulator
MVTNYEIAHGKVIPAFRRSVAVEMANTYHLKQSQIAGYLGVTQAAVSKYLHSKGKSAHTKHIEEFIAAVMSGNQKEGRDAMCRGCQATRKFDCAFMFKQ